ncbi:MAG: PIG-L family deacetylase [Bacteroidota bacterium]
MRKTILFFISTFCFASPVFSQAPQSWTSADMYLAIRKLNVLGSVLYIAAHPDDENTRLITYFSKDKLYRTGYLSMTRGDGGQNLIGDEQGIELGLIRTQELLAARRVDGGEQFFTRAIDFGYSKNPQETFTKWDKEKILSDVVWVIRKFQPDVIITRFPTTGEGGHGHHTASAILANEAFTAAADPTRFPEQLKYVQVWQAKRILWNSFNFGGTNLTSADQFKFDVGGYNPLLGKSYGEIAAISRSNHKSQGFGSAGSRGEALEYFKNTGGDAPSDDIMNGVEAGWKRVQGGDIIEKKINKIASSFELLHPENSVKELVALYQLLKTLPDGYWKMQKMKETQQLIGQCSGLFISATSSEQFVVQTDSILINFSLNNRLGASAILKNISVDAFDSTFNLPLEKNRNILFGKAFFVPASKPITQPYWLVNKMEEGYFNVPDQQKIGQADMDAGYTVNIRLNIEEQDFDFEQPVKYRFTDPVKGELYQPVFVIPGATVMSSPSLILFRNNLLQEKEVEMQVNANKKLPKNINYFLRTRDTLLTVKDTLGYNKLQSGHISFTINNSARVSGNKEKKRLLSQLDSLLKKKTITAAQKNEIEKYYTRSDDKDVAYAYAQQDDSTSYYLSVRAINYDHIPSIKYFFPDGLKTLFIDLKTYGKKIGYIIGAGDKVPEAVEQMGYDVTLLTDKELARNNFTAVRCDHYRCQGIQHE